MEKKHYQVVADGHIIYDGYDERRAQEAFLEAGIGDVERVQKLLNGKVVAKLGVRPTIDEISSSFADGY